MLLKVWHLLTALVLFSPTCCRHLLLANELATSREASVQPLLHFKLYSFFRNSLELCNFRFLSFSPGSLLQVSRLYSQALQALPLPQWLWTNVSTASGYWLTCIRCWRHALVVLVVRSGARIGGTRATRARHVSRLWRQRGGVRQCDSAHWRGSHEEWRESWGATQTGQDPALTSAPRSINMPWSVVWILNLTWILCVGAQRTGCYYFSSEVDDRKYSISVSQHLNTHSSKSCKFAQFCVICCEICSSTSLIFAQIHPETVIAMLQPLVFC